MIYSPLILEGTATAEIGGFGFIGETNRDSGVVTSF